LLNTGLSRRERAAGAALAKEIKIEETMMMPSSTTALTKASRAMLELAYSLDSADPCSPARRALMAAAASLAQIFPISSLRALGEEMATASLERS
jgi:hypothetical protein